jgi:hypothetical protein
MRLRRCCSGCLKWEIIDALGFVIARQSSLRELFAEFRRLHKLGILP